MVKRRFSLADLTVMVVAAAVALSLLRRTRGIVGATATGPAGFFAGGPPAVDPYRVFAIALVIVGVALVAILAIEIRRRRGGWFGVVWRLGAVALLATFLSTTSELLSAEVEAPSGTRLAYDLLRTNLVVVAIGFGLATAGILVADRTTKGRRAGRRRPWLPWFRPGSAIGEGVLLHALHCGQLILLVLMAMEAVSYALQHPGEMAEVVRLGSSRTYMTGTRVDSLATRSRAAAFEGFAVLIACVVCATWLGNDLRGTAPARVGPLRTAGRFLSAAACWIGGAWLALRTLPRFQPWYVEGFLVALHPTGWTAMLAGFGVLALGLAAYATSAERLPERPLAPKSAGSIWVGRVGGVLVVVVCAVLIDSALADPKIGLLRSGFRLGDALISFLHDPSLMFGTWTSGSPWMTYRPLLSIEAVALGVFLSALTWYAATLPMRGDAESPALDLVGRDRAGLFRWLGRSLVLAGVIFALFPTVLICSIELMRQFL